MSLKEISAAEDLMRIAFNQQSNIDALLGYYRDEIDDYNNERAEWVLNYENLQQSSHDQYLLEQETQNQIIILNELKSKLALNIA